MILIGVGSAVFGLGFSICLDVALAYITDCYHNVSRCETAARSTSCVPWVLIEVV